MSNRVKESYEKDVITIPIKGEGWKAFSKPDYYNSDQTKLVSMIIGSPYTNIDKNGFITWNEVHDTMIDRAFCFFLDEKYANECVNKFATICGLKKYIIRQIEYKEGVQEKTSKSFLAAGCRIALCKKFRVIDGLDY